MNETISTAYKNESDRCDYIFNFGPISNKNGIVKFIDCSKGKESKVYINIDDKDFAYGVRKKFPTIVADIVDLAVAIHASDRLAPHKLDQNQRCLHVVLPVRHPELLSAEPFQTKLKELLYWATGSEWVFEFQKRKTPGRLVEKQLVLPIIPKSSEVALWSGGLDALAGLYTRLQMYPEKSFVLFGSGSNNNVYSRQAEVAQKVKSIFPNRCYLCRVPIHFQDSGEYHKNKLSRGRGVVFTLLGAACAYLMGSQVLSIYENGVGAINLPYRASAIGLDHSRSVHPLTLLMVSDVISELLGEKFQVKNPFLFWTKGEMCQALAKDNRIDLPPITMSCDSPHRQQPIQCGYCSSCILRKQSLAASKIEDKTRYIVPHGERPKEDPTLYFRHMVAQVRTFQDLLTTSNEIDIQWQTLTREFPVLDDIVDRTTETENLSIADMQSSLIKLFQTYVSEWNMVKSIIERDFLDRDVAKIQQTFTVKS